MPETACPVCAMESGVGDDNLPQVREIRGYWVACGAKWDKPGSRPKDWDLRSSWPISRPNGADRRLRAPARVWRISALSRPPHAASTAPLDSGSVQQRGTL